MDHRTFAVATFDKWTAIWNGQIHLVDEIMAAHFTLRYAQPGTEPMDDVHTPEQLAALIVDWRKVRRNPEFRAEGTAVVEMIGAGVKPTGIVVRPYSSTFQTARGGRDTVSGIDHLRFENGEIVEVLSASGGPTGRSFGISGR